MEFLSKLGKIPMRWTTLKRAEPVQRSSNRVQCEILGFWFLFSLRSSEVWTQASEIDQVKSKAKRRLAALPPSQEQKFS